MTAVSSARKRAQGRDSTSKERTRKAPRRQGWIVAQPGVFDPVFLILIGVALRLLAFCDRVALRSYADLVWIRRHWLQITAVLVFIVLPILGEQWMFEICSLTYQLHGVDQELLRDGSRVIFAGLAGAVSGAFSPGGKRGVLQGCLLATAFAGVSEFWTITEVHWLVYYYPVHSMFTNDVHMVRKLTLLGKSLKVLVYAVIGGLYARYSGGNFAQGFKWCLTVSALSETALTMRAQMVIESYRDPRNCTGISCGFKHDNFKLAGGRINPNLPQQTPSPLGGLQGKEGYILGRPYEPGSFPDRIVESFAGPHDYLNHFIWYDETGNVKQGLTSDRFIWWVFKLIDAVNIAVASPFVIASVTPLAIVMLLKYARGRQPGEAKPDGDRDRAARPADSSFEAAAGQPAGGWGWLGTPAPVLVRQTVSQSFKILGR